MFRRTSIEPCLPRPAKEPPVGADWIHEIKHDGFRILARRNANGVRLFTRNGYHFDAVVRKETDSGCVIFKHTKMMKPNEANRIKMRALYESLLLTELSLADEGEAFVAQVRPKPTPEK
jgi:hypothetical protein